MAIGTRATMPPGCGKSLIRIPAGGRIRSSVRWPFRADGWWRSFCGDRSSFRNRWRWAFHEAIDKYGLPTERAPSCNPADPPAFSLPRANLVYLLARLHAREFRKTTVAERPAAQCLENFVAIRHPTSLGVYAPFTVLRVTINALRNPLRPACRRETPTLVRHSSPVDGPSPGCRRRIEGGVRCYRPPADRRRHPRSRCAPARE